MKFKGSFPMLESQLPTLFYKPAKPLPKAAEMLSIFALGGPEALAHFIESDSAWCDAAQQVVVHRVLEAFDGTDRWEVQEKQSADFLEFFDCLCVIGLFRTSIEWMYMPRINPNLPIMKQLPRNFKVTPCRDFDTPSRHRTADPDND